MNKIDLLFIDLDDTVYPENLGLWPFFAKRIHDYMHKTVGIPDEQVPEIRERLFHTYGTTLRGLQTEYGADMHDYLAYVHDVDLSAYIKADPELRRSLEACPQEKWIFTNASRAHAENVLGLTGIRDLFSGIIDVVDTSPYCKPQPEAFELGFAKAGKPNLKNSLFVDDRSENLDTAKALGLQTLQIDLLHNAENGHPKIQRLAELGTWLAQVQAQA